MKSETHYHERDPKELHNRFFDMICFLLSFLLSPFRSAALFFAVKKNIIHKNFFFDFLDFFFRAWPKYFFSKPSAMKLGSIIADLWKHIFSK